jgi:L-ascorbate metabolism protein UlaG (beta-lactamase superfamily)
MLIWLGHAAFRISAEKQIYIDPLNVKKGSPGADVILITHDHAGHCSIADVEKIITPRTVIAANQKSIDRLKGLPVRFLRVEPGQLFTAADMTFEAVPAYGTGHGKQDEGLGFVVVVSGQRIYHAGDTGCIPEMSAIRCSIALLPVSGGRVMSAADAAGAAEKMHPSLAIAMHYGLTAGSIDDARSFAALAFQKGVATKLLTPS